MDTITQEVVAMKPKPRVVLSIRLTDEKIKEAIVKAAEEKDKTISGYVLWLIAKDNENVAKTILDEL